MLRQNCAQHWKMRPNFIVAGVPADKVLGLDPNESPEFILPATWPLFKKPRDRFCKVGGALGIF